MDQKLLNKAITISGKEEKLQGGKPVVKIKDEKNLTYTVYKTKQDGTESVAWQQLQGLNLGDTVQIGFVEDLGEYEGKTVTYRTIRNFNKDIGEGMQNASQPQASNSGLSGNPVDEYKAIQNKFDKRITLYGMVNARLSAGADLESISKELPAFTVFIDEINEIASRPASMNKAQTKIFSEELPTIQVGEPLPPEPPEEIDVSDIPF